MDGSEVAEVLQGLYDLTELLRRKLRYAAEHGKAFFKLGAQR